MSEATITGHAVECIVCRRTKQPRGRSAPLGLSLCDSDCRGYRLDPFPGDLWPGETSTEFGFACSGAADEWPDGKAALLRAEAERLREALEVVWAAIGDALCSGKGISKEYGQSVAAQVTAALAKEGRR